MKIFIQLSALLCCIIIGCHSFNSATDGVAFSPYTKKGGRTENTYTYEDIKAQLNTVASKFKWISTYSMGVNQGSKDKKWDQGEGDCLVARAASDLNQNNAQLKVSIGVYQNDADRSIENREIENAFKAAAEANQRSKGTVWGIVFTNEYISNTNTAIRVLDMIRANKNKGIKVGTRTHKCEFIMNDVNQDLRFIMIQIAKESNFIMCNVYPDANNCNSGAGVQNSITEIGRKMLLYRTEFQKYNQKLEVMIGETGWASEGKTFNNCPNNVNNLKNFWYGMSEWGRQKNMKIHFFEGIDEPWKGEKGEEDAGEKHFGWWYRNGDESPPNIVEK